MGVAHRDEIARRLMAGGLPPSTPVAAITLGTRPEQRTVRTTLDGLGAAEVRPPAIIVVGRVAALNLAWYENRPLFGRTVVVTRAREQASTLTGRLQALGAAVIEVPAIELIEPADGGTALAAAAATVGTYDWVVFTSSNAVDRFLRLLRDARAFGGSRVAAIGPGTAAALSAWRVQADLVPERAVGEGLLEAFPPPPGGGGRVLLPRAAVARDVLPDGLRTAGWVVDVVEAYRTVPAVPSVDVIAAAKQADAITFTSASTVMRFVEAAGRDAVPPVVVCIGPITAEAARTAGLAVDVVADEHSIDGLIAALTRRLGA
jgi:uroporphyrinogen III methyltransferase/synthase